MGQKTVLITGSSEGGIGDALAKEFHKRGLQVFATARYATSLEKYCPFRVLLTVKVTSNPRMSYYSRDIHSTPETP